MTISTDHPIRTGLNLLREKLAKNERIKLYFAIPASLFDIYQKQNFITTRDTIARKLPNWIRDHVEQYALEINLSVGSSGSRNVNKGFESGAHTRIRTEDPSRHRELYRYDSSRHDRESYEHGRSHDRDSFRRYDRNPDSYSRSFGSKKQRY